MKSKHLWAAALLVLGLCVVMFWQFYQQQNAPYRIGIGVKSLVLAAPESPTFVWGNQPADIGLKSLSSATIELKKLESTNRQRYFQSSVVKPQSGLYLIEIGSQRVLFLTNNFTVFDPSSAINLESDWIVLERSSLLPENWPQPNFGWAVLSSGTLSKALKAESLVAQKPIIRPQGNSTVWLEKPVSGDWEVHVPMP